MTMCVTPVAGALGADVTGIDLTTLDDAGVAALRAAVLEHLVVFVRDQHRLGVEGLEGFTVRLGTPIETPFVTPLDDGHRHVVRVLKEAGERASNFGGGWHTDLSYLPEPPSFTLLWAFDVPPYGGDTLWSNQYLAYETLSKGLQDALRSLRAVHTAGLPYSPTGIYAKESQKRSMQINPSDAAYAELEHPVVVRHPETGKPILYLNPTYVNRFAGWSARDSAPLLRHLSHHATREPFTCRMRWNPGTLAIWDNRSTQHYALDDYPRFRRELFRTTTAGTAPIAA